MTVELNEDECRFLERLMSCGQIQFSYPTTADGILEKLRNAGGRNSVYNSCVKKIYDKTGDNNK